MSQSEDQPPDRTGLDHSIRKATWTVVAGYSRVEDLSKAEIRRRVIAAAAHALAAPDPKFSWKGEIAPFARCRDTNWTLPEMDPDSVLSGPFRLLLRSHRRGDEIVYLRNRLLERVERHLDRIGLR
ncbi:MAG TPA: hypothetical protein VF590_03135 [Isosphaeraceae bacterium]|jgi:hypothetical protein